MKSLGGLQVRRATVDRRGLVDDRRFMVVEPSGRFLTQRELPQMALLSASLSGDALRLADRSGDTHVVSRGEAASGPEIDVAIWGESARATEAPPAASVWLSERLDREVRLVFQPAHLGRPVDPRYAGAGDQVSFADGFSLLLTSTASLDELNRRLVDAGAAAVPMSRFRPNVVVSGCQPFEEDRWTAIRINGMRFALNKPCERCSMTTVKDGRKTVEPLRTLATFRRIDGKILFGHNLVHSGTGELRVGMEVECEL